MVKQKVNVLISTYNGEKFIEQQIESILQQTYTNFHIYIRDDHSSDRTVQKIERFLNTGKVTIFRGDNIGFAQSFLELLKKQMKEAIGLFVTRMIYGCRTNYFGQWSGWNSRI